MKLEASADSEGTSFFYFGAGVLSSRRRAGPHPGERKVVKQACDGDAVCAIRRRRAEETRSSNEAHTYPLNTRAPPRRPRGRERIPRAPPGRLLNAKREKPSGGSRTTLSSAAAARCRSI